MKIQLQKDLFQEKLHTAARFCLSKTSTIPSLQGGQIHVANSTLSIFSTDLNDFFFSSIPIKSNENIDITCVVDVKKIDEFIQYLPIGEIEIEINEKSFIVHHNKTTGVFNLIEGNDFPKIPSITGKSVDYMNFFKDAISWVLFSVSHDPSRPILNGVHFVKKEDKMYAVTTDGFRLSLFSKNMKEDFPSVVISSTILSELNHFKNTKKTIINISENEHMISFSNGEDIIFSRLIQGDFPPFDRVIPKESKTRIVIDREDFIRNIKLSSVFARDFSSILIFDIKKDGFFLRPKTNDEKGTVIFQEAQITGDEQKTAFNYRFIFDFLNNAKAKEVIIEMNSNSSPGVFKEVENENFLHIIMPIRMD